MMMAATASSRAKGNSVHAASAEDNKSARKPSRRMSSFADGARKFSSVGSLPPMGKSMSSRTASIREMVTGSPQADNRKKSTHQLRSEEIKKTVKLSFSAKDIASGEEGNVNSRKQCLHDFFLFNPQNMRVYDAGLLILLAWTVFTAPLDLFFEEKYCEEVRDTSAFYPLICLVEALYLLDIAISFVTIKVSGDEFHGLELVDQYDKIALAYLKGRFLFDALGSLPVISLFTECNRGYISTVLSLMKLFRLARMPAMYYRYTHVHSVKLAKRLEDRNSFQVLKQVFLLLLFTHFIACAFYSLGRFNGEQGWLHNTDPTRLEATASWDKQYVYALYWTMATLATVGYGDINPIADNEMVFSILVMLFGAVLYASVFGVVTVTLQNLNEDRNRYQEKTAVVRSFIFNYRKDLSHELQDRIMNYTDFMWKINKGFDLESVASAFPLDMHEQIKMSILSGFVYKVDFFDGLADDFVRGICMGLRSNACLENDYIYREGHYGLHMIFLRKGCVNLLVNVAGVMSILDEIEEGGYFGEISWFLKIKRTETAMAASNCEYYTLGYETFEKATQKHPEYNDLIRLKVKKKLLNDVQDWEDAEMGFSDAYTHDSKDNLTEKLKIAKQMVFMCDQQCLDPNVTMVEGRGRRASRSGGAIKARRASVKEPSSRLPSGSLLSPGSSRRDSIGKAGAMDINGPLGGEEDIMRNLMNMGSEMPVAGLTDSSGYIHQMVQENRAQLQRNEIMLEAISKHLGLPLPMTSIASRSEAPSVSTSAAGSLNSTPAVSLRSTMTDEN